MNWIATILIGLISGFGGAFLNAPANYSTLDHDWQHPPTIFGAISYPTSLDTFTNPGATDSVATVSHSGQHSNANDAIEALEAKVGITASTPTSGTVLYGDGAGSSSWSAIPTLTDLTITGSSTIASLVWTNATGSNATTTSFFSTTASSTNLQTSQLGVASSTPFSALSVGVGNSITVAENNLSTSTSMTIDWNVGNQQVIQKGTAGITLTFSNVTPGKKLLLISCNPASGTGGSLTFPANVYWPSATAPTETTTAGNCDMFSFVGTVASSTATTIIFGGYNQNY